MYFKLALKNVRKSFKDFLIYFLTLAFSVCLFYTFNSFQAQQAVLEMNQAQVNIVETLVMLMSFLSVFVTIVLAFLILYANNFLIKRRKKELGLYTLLGMPKRKISIVLVYETFFIGLISLVVGLMLGLFVSQILTVITASLFDVALNYSFVFSIEATIITLVAFGGIFLLTMIFNSIILNRYKLIDLINADRKNDELKIKNIWISILLFLLSLLLLGGTYTFAMNDAYKAFMNMSYIIISGSLGTLLFFLSLAGFLLTITKSSKKIYFKNLNCFVLRQIHSNINSNFISMSIVCIMLLLSIGALSTGLSINSGINATIKNSTPYDYTYYEDAYYASDARKNLNLPENVEVLLKSLPIDRSVIQSENIEKLYLADVTLAKSKLLNTVSSSSKDMISGGVDSLSILSLSDYNNEMKARGYDTISLAPKDAFIYSNMETMKDIISEIMENKPTFTLYGHDVTIKNSDYYPITLGTTTVVNSTPIVIVVNDTLIPDNAKVFTYYWNVNLHDNVSSKQFKENVSGALQKVNESLPENVFFQTIDVYSATIDDVYVNSKGISVVFTYIGIYLGIVFMIASAVILALQQLSQANENKKRYMILSKIGTEQRMINRSILSQIAIYFLLPLALAVVHSYVGIHVVNVMVMMFGKSNIMMSSLYTAGIILFIYGSYFLVTYMGYKNILRS